MKKLVHIISFVACLSVLCLWSLIANTNSDTTMSTAIPMENGIKEFHSTEIIAYEDWQDIAPDYQGRLENLLAGLDGIENAYVDIAESSCSVEIALDDSSQELSDELRNAIVKLIVDANISIDGDEITIVVI